MMTSRVEGSFSSSNLSPLAPPFKVDKSHTKPISINPSSNIIKGALNGSCFDPFAYDLFPNNMSSNTNEAEKSGYGLFSHSGSTHLSGSVPPLVDLPNDGGYASKWGPFWSRFNEVEHGKWTDYVQGLILEDLGVSHLPSNKGPIFVDGSNNESQSQPFVDINVHPVGDGISGDYRGQSQSHLKRGDASTLDLGLRGPTSTSQDTCFDIFGGAFSLDRLGIEQEGCKPLIECSNKRTSPIFNTELPYASKPSNNNEGYNFTYQMEARVPPDPNRNSTIKTRKPLPSFDNTMVDTKVSYEKMTFPPQLNHQLSLQGLNMEDSDVDVEAPYSVEKNSSRSYLHNPVEDSPCWKGAPSHHVLPFIPLESADFGVLIKNFDNCSILSSQDLKNNSVFSHEFGSKSYTSGKLNEILGVYDRVLNNHEDRNTEDGLQFDEDLHESMAESDIMKKSKLDLCGLSSIIENNIPNLVPKKKPSVKSRGEDLESKIDINVVLGKMMDLSEKLRCYCFSNGAEVSEKYSLVVKQILRNLKASMLLISGQSIPTALLSSSNKRGLNENPVVQTANVATKDAFDISCKDDNNSFEDANMTEVVTKLISKDFDEEEMDQHKLLYKNLWLEAEASLCLMTAKTRFLCMKSEMKRTHDGEKDENNPTSSNVPLDLRKEVDLANDGIHALSLNECPNLTTSQHDHVKVQAGQIVYSEADVTRTTKTSTSFTSLWPPRLGALGNNQDSCSTSHANEVETRVKAKDRVTCPDTLNYESEQTSSEHKCSSSTNSNVKDTGTLVFGGYQTLKDNPGYHNYEGQQLTEDENYLPNNDCSTIENVLEELLMSNFCVTDEHTASVVARFRLIKNRMDHSKSLISGPKKVSAKAVDEGSEDTAECKRKGNIKNNSFGPYPKLFEEENVNSFDIGVNEEAFDAPIVKINRISNVILEDWYDNDFSPLDWEHISSHDVEDPRVDAF